MSSIWEHLSAEARRENGRRTIKIAGFYKDLNKWAATLLGLRASVTDKMYKTLDNPLSRQMSNEDELSLRVLHLRSVGLMQEVEILAEDIKAFNMMKKV